MATEVVVLAPLLVLLGLVVVGLGRLTDARVVVADASHQAARAASIERTEAAAHHAARTAAASALREADSSCQHPQVQLTTRGLTPGTTVSATVACTAALDDLTHTGLPGSLTLRHEAVSPVDTYRSSP